MITSSFQLPVCWLPKAANKMMWIPLRGAVMGVFSWNRFHLAGVETCCGFPYTQHCRLPHNTRANSLDYRTLHLYPNHWFSSCIEKLFFIFISNHNSLVIKILGVKIVHRGKNVYCQPISIRYLLSWKNTVVVFFYLLCRTFFDSINFAFLS